MVLELGCNDLGILYSNLGGVSLGFVGQLFLFLTFSFGKTVNDPGKWIYSVSIVTKIISSTKSSMIFVGYWL